MGKAGYSAEEILEKVPLLRKTLTPTWPQHLAGISAGLMTMSMGFVAGWSAFATPYLRGKVAQLPFAPVDTAQVSWIASIVTLGALLGCLPSGYVAGRLGRKVYLLSLTVPLVAGWMLIMLSEGRVSWIYLGRFMCGLAFGGVTVTVPLYNNEIVEDRLRGKIGSYFDLMLSLGLFLVYVIGANTSYYLFSVICCTFPLAFVCLFVWMPESPYFLISKGRIDEAKEAIRWLRRGITEEALEVEINLINCILQQSSSSHTNSVKSLDYAKQSLNKLKNWNITSKAIVMAIGMMTFQRMSGVSAIMYYTVDIFHDANTSISPENATILVGLLGVIGCLISALLVDRIGRRVLLIYSGFIMALGYTFMAAYFMAVHYGYQMDYQMRCIPLLAVCLVVLFFTIGLGPVPWFMIPELLPEDVKGMALSATVAYKWVITFLVIKMFPVMVVEVGYAITYALMAAVCASGLLFFEHCIPETKNMSPFEIHDEIAYYLNFGRHNVRSKYTEILNSPESEAKYTRNVTTVYG
ncbi:facilitated trehalose transporter Tret1-2 homolog isoform X1 [Nilaparvata lugens]|uniref:Sugar transporter n=1 Tax=Nilaparvata lugens TaxID=108931 RepID=A0A0A8J8I1_NILLU|nr:facilitated trehalose transporter Tret1-2 homolog isoform X1 [Nilaparvata lugens]XP_022185513.1 facilitated trehalose transporter Tret1-2 homolog isoform X1 [Nilaparvata lugens]XP_022185514.1 facilitated trehalose transporter Tret1-2 homolog isoform X1 [Nilaparvata lugens]XP_022185515.1 facilitated trehalose transporter Tret1-2 homolog isoform X1 [Nilaparvata lugens]BAQ02348.1 sugar transporter [Nilaparvata lugens]